MGFLKDFKDDFSQAVTELMPAEEETKQENVIAFDEPEVLKAPPAEEIPAAMEIPAAELVEEHQAETPAKSVNMVKEKEEEENMAEEMLISLPAEEMQMPETSETETEEVTTISKGVKLEGNLSSKGSVELLGDVTGDVRCQGKLLVYGTIIGNPSAAEIYANAARIEGNVTSDGSVKIGTGSIIIGNITASSVVIGGAVKGDIDVDGPVIIDSTAVVVGNIKSRSVQLNNGAVIDGYVSQCYAGVDVDKLFASRNEEQKTQKK